MKRRTKTISFNLKYKNTMATRKTKTGIALPGDTAEDRFAVVVETQYESGEFGSPVVWYKGQSICGLGLSENELSECVKLRRLELVNTSVCLARGTRTAKALESDALRFAGTKLLLMKFTEYSNLKR